MDRPPGLSVRLKLTLSYTGFLMLAGVLLLGAFAMFLRGYRERAQRAGEVVIAPAGSSLMRDFAPAAVGVMAFLLIFGLVGGWLLAGRMLAPLARITDATRTAATGSLSHRIALEGPHDEFRELADAFDGMLARLESHVGEQQRFAANASHELRTPLATSKAMLEVARTDPSADVGALIERLDAVNARAIDLTEALLLLSRAERQSFVPQPVDVSLLVEEAAETLLPLTEERGVTVHVSGTVALASGSPTLLLHLTMNLLRNAIVHNLPQHGAVWVATTTVNGEVQLAIENTGEPLTPEVVSTLTEPFQRGGRGRGEPGVGLGLAIVRSVVNAHRGSLALAPRAGGGVDVRVWLPAAA